MDENEVEGSVANDLIGDAAALAATGISRLWHLLRTVSGAAAPAASRAHGFRGGGEAAGPSLVDELIGNPGVHPVGCFKNRQRSAGTRRVHQTTCVYGRGSESGHRYADSINRPLLMFMVRRGRQLVHQTA
jgi:hypothetical protein